MKKTSFTLYLFAVLLAYSPLTASPLMGFGCSYEASLQGDEARKLFEKAGPKYLSHHILLGWNSSERRYGERSFYIHYAKNVFFSCSAPDVDDWIDHLTCICPDASYQFSTQLVGLREPEVGYPLWTITHLLSRSFIEII